jgi:hypothetical protein
MGHGRDLKNPIECAPKRGMKSYDFRSAIGVDAEGAKGAVRPRREGHLIAPPCTSWHLPSSNRVPISKDIFMDERARESGLP